MPSWPDRLSLFIDYQNVYRSAREAYGSAQSLSSFGQVDPLELGRLIAGATPPGSRVRAPGEVRLYVGRPAQNRNPRVYQASRRQAQAWEAQGALVTVRTLRYPPSGPPIEKGIDVALAVDLVAGAIDGAFDVAVVFSTDTDLLPALEFVAGRASAIKLEVAKWAEHPNAALATSQLRPWCHRLTRADFELVADPTVYVR